MYVSLHTFSSPFWEITIHIIKYNFTPVRACMQYYSLVFWALKSISSGKNRTFISSHFWILNRNMAPLEFLAESGVFLILLPGRREQSDSKRYPLWVWNDEHSKSWRVSEGCWCWRSLQMRDEAWSIMRDWVQTRPRSASQGPSPCLNTWPARDVSGDVMGLSRQHPKTPGHGRYMSLLSSSELF